MNDPSNSRPEAAAGDPVTLSPGHPVIFLIGPRGSGKTTVGPLLAAELGWEWLDADPLMEARAGRSIRAIFADEGESGFRDREEALLSELCQRQGVVVATGGGVVLRETNRARMKAAGRVVWLTADAATLWQRMEADPTTAERRPMLTVGGLAEVEELLRLREPLYRACADLIIDTAAHSPEEIVNFILATLSR